MPVFSIHSRCNRLALRTAGFFTLCCDEEFGYKSCQTVIGAARAFLVQCLGELYQRGNHSAPLAVCSFSTRFAARSSPTTVIKNSHVMQQVNHASTAHIPKLRSPYAHTFAPTGTDLVCLVLPATQ